MLAHGIFALLKAILSIWVISANTLLIWIESAIIIKQSGYIKCERALQRIVGVLLESNGVKKTRCVHNLFSF